MSKPLGVWQAYTKAPTPEWALWRAILDFEDDERFRQCAAESRETGLLWVLLLYGCPMAQPVKAHALAVAKRLEDTGLRPYVIAVCYHEEWYGALQQYVTADHVALMSWIPIVREHVSRQLVDVKAALPGLLTVWVDSIINDDPSFGVQWWHPVPRGIDVLAFQAYPGSTGAWDIDNEIFLAHAIATRPEPLVLVPGVFRQPGTALFDRGPTEDFVAGLAKAMELTRVLGAWAFDYESAGPGHNMIGFADLPELRESVLKALGVSHAGVWPDGDLEGEMRVRS